MKTINIMCFLLILIIVPAYVNGYIIKINGNTMHIYNSTGYADNTNPNILAYKVNDTLSFEAVPVDNIASAIITSGYMKWDFGDGSETTYQNNGALIDTTHIYKFPFPYPVSWCGYLSNIYYPKSITYNWLIVGDVRNTIYNFKINTSHDKNSYDVLTTYNNITNETVVNISYYSDTTTGNYTFHGLSVDTTPVNIIASKSDIVEGDSVKFNISTNGTIIFCMWSFGDGTHSFERSPTHTYNSPGFYFPQVLIVDSNGYVRVGYTSIEVKKVRGGYIYWVMGPINYGGEAYTYVYNSSGSDNNNGGNSLTNPYDLTYKVNDSTEFSMSGAWGKYWKWDFGDGSETSYSSKSVFTPSYHKYKFPFMWPFFWMSYGSGSWWKSDTFNFIIVGDVGNTLYNFLPSSTHDKTTYDYSYDSENHVVNISYYSDVINKSVLGVKLKDGYYTDITATANPTEVNVGQYVHFSYSYSGSPIFIMWSFGDGTYSFEKNPVHKYTSRGLFYPHVYIIDRNGNAALGITPPIGVGGYSSDPQIYVSPSLVHTGEPVNITIVEPAYYTWYEHTILFGDGTYEYLIPHTSPYLFTHSYYSEGVYKIDMKVDGCENAKSVYVIDNHAPKAVLYVYPNPASYVQDVVFNPVNSYDPDTGRSIPVYDEYGNYVDDYIISPNSPIAKIYGYNLTVYNSTGDIVYNVSYNELKECQHQFTVGNYTANLTVWDGEGKSSSVIVPFSVINKKPVAEFTYSPSNPKINQVVYFDASQSYDPEGKIAKYRWDFGDGSIGYGEFVAHKYTNFGIYPVKLTVWDEMNASSSITENITISGVKANFSYIPSYVLINTPINFTDKSESYPGSIVKWDWDFGDGATSNVKNPVHEYSKEGVYFVTLKVTNQYGETGEVLKIVAVNSKEKYPPVAKFTFKLINGTNATFDASQSYDPDGTIVKYIWNFGDGNITTTTDSIISHDYKESKTYKVSLTVVDNDNMTGTTFRFIDISKGYSSVPIPFYVNILIAVITLISIGYIMRGLK